MNLPSGLPADFVAALEQSPLAKRDFAAMAVARDVSPSDNRLVRKLARDFKRSHKIREFLRALVPEHWATYGKFRMKLCPRDNYTDYVIWRSGKSPESSSIAVLVAAVVEEPCLIFDIGANSGSFTLPLAAAAERGSTILAFEPNPLLAQRLADNLEANGLSGRVTIHQTALSDQRGMAQLHFVGRNFGEASLNPEPGTAGTSINVDTAPLADFLDQADPRPVIMKIDIEGHEDRALAPYLLAEPALRLPALIVIETAHRENWGLDLVKLLKEKGYQALFEMEGNTLFLRVN